MPFWQGILLNVTLFCPSVNADIFGLAVKVKDGIVEFLGQRASRILPTNIAYW